MELKKLNVVEFRQNLASVMKEAYLGKRFVLERNGIPVAILIGINDYLQSQSGHEDLKQMLKSMVKSDSEKGKKSQSLRNSKEKRLKKGGKFRAFSMGAIKGKLTRNEIYEDI